MHNEPRQQLCQLIAQYGRTLSEDPRRCGALLKDYCGQYKREIFILVNALENRVATELLNASAGVPEVVLLSRLSKRLEDELGLAETAAKWAVETWALALGVISQPLAIVAQISQQPQILSQQFNQIVSNPSSKSWPSNYKSSILFFNGKLDIESRQDSLCLSASDPKKWQKAPCFISLNRQEISDFILLINKCDEICKKGNGNLMNIVGTIGSDYYSTGKLDFRVCNNSVSEFCIHFSDPSDRRKTGFSFFFDDQKKKELKSILENFL
jgi:hypothetical protein